MPTYLYFLLWGAFFFMMMRLGCGAHIMGHGHVHRDGGNKQDNATSNGDADFPRSTGVKNEHRH
jgi:hypothetical protein